ncbi:RcnB family protein [Caballeronia sp. GAWG2-1]|uniref:RcnB family protein n=1 Tax=Caballeronia sp. GAWG2-1 TaxID=2921744 RepID=UPI002027BED7|nr:RcnB family protein [Caballeronia sp. GAWG2-1]
MKQNRIVAALLCATLSLAAGASFAQQGPGGPDQNHGGGPGQKHGGPQNHGGPGQPGHGPANYGHDAPRPPEHADNGPRHSDWQKGQHLSQDYRDHQYVVDNYHEHGLRQPPRGYQWVGVGGDYLLVAVASGIIAQVVLSQ